MKTQLPHRSSILIALALAAALGGCGKSTSAVRPGTPAPQPLTQETADEIAQRSAAMLQAGGALSATNAIVFASFAGGAPAARDGARPAAAGTVDTDSTSYTYALHAYGADGHEVDWTTPGHDAIARVTVAWTFHSQSTSDSLNWLWHSTGAAEYSGFEPTATRWVVSGTQDDAWSMDLWQLPYHWISQYAGNTAMSGVTWEKSGTPAYPVAGRITFHWNTDWDYTVGTSRNAGSSVADCTMTFDGSRWADLVVGAFHYRLDLLTGVVEHLPAAAAVRRVA